jgi:hypothetical protein
MLSDIPYTRVEERDISMPCTALHVLSHVHGACLTNETAMCADRYRDTSSRLGVCIAVVTL